MARINYGQRTRTFTTTDRLWGLVKMAAAEAKVTLAEYVRRALCYYLDRHR